MKSKIIMLLFVLLLLAGCTEEIEPIENPIVEDFNIFYAEDEDFTIYRRTEIDDDVIYTMIGYQLDDGDSGLLIGSYHMLNFMVLYDDEFYTLLDGNKLGLYSGQDLIDFGIDGISVRCDDASCDEE